MTEPTGVLAFWKNYDRKLYLKAAILADELGYDSFWIPEAWGYEIFSLLTEMAIHTKRIKLGTGIVNVFSRSPGLIAMNAATVDEISEGRLILGIGTSGKRVIEGFHGRAFSKPLTQWRDVVRVTRTLLSGRKLTEADAKLVDYRPFALEMNPVRADIPIYVAALKEKSITSIGELADGWIPTFWPYQDLKRGHEWIAAGAAKSGRDPSEIVTAPFTTVLPLPGDMGKQKAKEIVAFYIGGMGDYYKELLTELGYGEDADKIDIAYKDKGTRKQSWQTVPDDLMNALMIAGDPSYCVEELRRRRDFGIGLPILNLPNGMPWPMIEQFLRAMAPGQ